MQLFDEFLQRYQRPLAFGLMLLGLLGALVTLIRAGHRLDMILPF